MIKDKKDTSVTLTWKPPSNDGGSKIIAYHIQQKENDGDWENIAKVKALDLDYKINNLLPGKSYSFAILAENAVGKGPAVEISEPVVLKAKPGTTVKSFCTMS